MQYQHCNKIALIIKYNHKIHFNKRHYHLTPLQSNISQTYIIFISLIPIKRSHFFDQNNFTTKGQKSWHILDVQHNSVWKRVLSNDFSMPKKTLKKYLILHLVLCNGHWDRNKYIGNESREEMRACLEPGEVWVLRGFWPLLPLLDRDRAPPLGKPCLSRPVLWTKDCTSF